MKFSKVLLLYKNTSIKLSASRIWDLLGIDSAIMYTIMTRVWTNAAGLITIYLISTKLSNTEQGFYYTFSSILAMQIFFELGFSNVLSQFASHEMAKLSWRDGKLSGDKPSVRRLKYLFKLAIRWYLICSIAMLTGLLIFGYSFFNSQLRDPSINWQLPWIFLVIAASGNLFISPLISLFEGSGFLAQIAKFKFIQSITSNSISWILLSLGTKLFISAAAATVILLTSTFWLYNNFRHFIFDVLHEKHSEEAISWKNDIWPMQWKIALSWLSGYFIFQIFTPIAFKYHGPVIAGQVGMSLTITSALSVFAMAWINTKTPLFCQCIANNDNALLEYYFQKSFKQSIGILLASVAILNGGILFINYNNLAIASRILPPFQFSMLTVTVIANHIIFSQATFIRAHKKELYLGHAILLAILIGSICYYLGRYQTVSDMLSSYTIIMIAIGVPYSTFIYRNFKIKKQT
ncbi:hypothetical protein [Aquitalea denitrificans]|uniref:hypothetical protein n=1 Tax=Aquitalea denitrificans TaxID=519081 RepID=UPI00135B4124|nr:hypothetical protein [Aquitalea denitrificans]